MNPASFEECDCICCQNARQNLRAGLIPEGPLGCRCELAPPQQRCWCKYCMDSLAGDCGFGPIIAIVWAILLAGALWLLFALVKVLSDHPGEFRWDP